MLFIKPLMFAFCGLFFYQCAALHRDIPKATRNKRTIHIEEKLVVEERKQLVIPSEKETTLAAEELKPIEKKSLSSEEKSEESYTKDEQAKKEQPSQIVQTSTPIVDTLFVTEKELDFSEKTARNALGFSIISVLGILFFPLLFVGIIGSLIYINRLNKLPIVSSKAIRTKKTAVTILIVLFVLVILTILLILAAYLGFFF